MNWKQLTIPRAFALYRKQRAAQVSAATLRTWRWSGQALAAHLGRSKRLCDVRPEHLEQFQLARQSEHRAPATINLDLAVLRQVLKRAHLWSRFADIYKSIPNRKTPPGRAISPDQQQQLLTIAASKPSWADTYHAAVLAFYAGLRTVEIKHLRWKTLTFRIDRYPSAGPRPGPANGR